jgi:hypothetical protein
MLATTKCWKDDEGAKMLNSVLAECDAMAVMKGLTHEDLENVDVAAGDGAINLGAASSKIDDAPVVRFINKAMLDAINEKVRTFTSRHMKRLNACDFAWKTSYRRFRRLP